MDEKSLNATKEDLWIPRSNPTSEAIVTLRKRMGLSQQRFATEVLKGAISTLARYETSSPPHGEVLRQLAEVAKREGFLDLHHRFRMIDAEEYFFHYMTPFDDHYPGGAQAFMFFPESSQG